MPRALRWLRAWGRLGPGQAGRPVLLPGVRALLVAIHLWSRGCCRVLVLGHLGVLCGGGCSRGGVPREGRVLLRVVRESCLAPPRVEQLCSAHLSGSPSPSPGSLLWSTP